MVFRLRAFLLFFMLAALTIPLFCQEDGEDEDDDEAIASDWSGIASVYSRGDQIFNVNLGLVFPHFYYGGGIGKVDTNIDMGGMASLAYHYFFTPHIYLGGELSAMFAPTIGDNMYYSIPFGMRAGYQFVLGRFEFPLTLMLGFAAQSYLDSSYFGFFAKPVVGAYFRITQNWSFGVQTEYWWIPQIGATNKMDNASSAVHGFFWDIGIGIRYHF
ncbi:MAG: hypothetical protein LBJ31_02230 [Treponema sp.]|nr:hypothetical protein [Treponema sp.]